MCPEKSPLSVENLQLDKNTPLDAASSSLQALSASSKALELTFPVKKDLASLFVRDITKKHMEAVAHVIDDLSKKLLFIDREYQKKSDIFAPFPHKILDTKLALEQNLLVFKNQITFSNTWLSYENVLLLVQNLQKKVYTISSLWEQYRLSLDEQNATLPAKQRDSQDLIEQSVNEYTQSLYTMFDEFSQMYVSHVSLEKSLQYLEGEQKKIEAEIAILLKQYDETSDALVDANKQLDTVSKQWFLGTFEFFDPSLKIDQLVSQKSVHETLQKIISLYAKKDEFAQYNITPPKSILLSWPKETGKTLAAKILAAETNRKMYHITYHDVFSEEATDPNQMLSDIFYTITEHVQEEQWPCVIFLDEIEKMIDSTGKINSASQQIIINTIEKNIFAIKKSNLDIIVVAAFGSLDRNNLSIVDSNVFDENIIFDLPNKEELQAVFQQNIWLYSSGFAVSDYALLWEKCKGMTPSYIHKLITACATDFSFCRINGDVDFVINEQYILDKHASLQQKRGTKYLWQQC